MRLEKRLSHGILGEQLFLLTIVKSGVMLGGSFAIIIYLLNYIAFLSKLMNCLSIDEDYYLSIYILKMIQSQFCDRLRSFDRKLIKVCFHIFTVRFAMCNVRSPAVITKPGFSFQFI